MGAQLSEKAKAVKDKAIAIQGNETMDGLVNWEASQTSDAERFSQNNNGKSNGTKDTSSFDIYLKKKAIRAEEKKIAKNKLSI